MKRALTIGINYPGQASELRGCVNDSHTIKALLINNYGFDESEIVQVLDNDATTDRMKTELIKLVDGAKPGDVLFFHYSGHGSQIIDRGGEEADRLDEILCPVDLDWRDKLISDDFLKMVFDSVPTGVNLTVLLDCCNSGGGVDAVHEFQTELGEAREQGGRYLEPPPEIKAQMVNLPEPTRSTSILRNVDTACMLISGAQAHQTAADALIDGVYQGATTYAFNRSLDVLGGSATYYQVIHYLNQFMKDNGFSQRPQLDGPRSLHHQVVLSSYDFGDPNDVAVVPVPTPTPTAYNPDQNYYYDSTSANSPNVVTDFVVNNNNETDGKDKNKLLIVAGVLLLGAIIAVLVV